MTKSLLITFYFPPNVGGIEDYLANICAGISDKIIVLAPKVRNSGEFDQQQKYRIYRFNLYWSLIAKYPRLYRVFVSLILFLFIIHSLKIIKRENIDLIQCGSADLSLAAWCLAKFTQKPYLVYAYGKDIQVNQNSILSRIWKNKLVSFALKKAEALITISQFSKMRLAELGVKSSKITVINPCVKEEVFYPNQEEAVHVRQKYNLENKKVLLSVGRLVARKGNDCVIEALPAILEQVPNTIYLIIGKGREKGRLQHLTKELGLEGNVIFVGYVDNTQLNSYYNVCDAFIMPSRELPGDVEGFGIVYLEANACKKPVIGGRTGGIRDAVVDGKTGLLVNPINTKEISDAVLGILSDEKLAGDLGKRGHDRVIDEFSNRGIAEKVNRVIHTIFQ